MIKKYAVEDNCWAKLETSIDATATKIRIKETHNLPQSWEWIATLVKKQGDEIIKMEKVLVVKRELNLLTVQRGFQSTAQAWEENDVLNLYITAEIIREIQRGFDKKADLIDGKVPKSQIPEISLDESNLVHKSWDEVIEGKKTFNGDAVLNWAVVLKDFWWNYVNWQQEYWFKLGTKEFWWNAAFSHPRWFWPLFNWVETRTWKSMMRLQQLGDGSIDFYVNNQKWSGGREHYTPTLSWDSWWGATFSDSQGRYKVIGKICFVQVRGIIWNKGTCSWAFKVSLPKLAIDRFSIPLAWWIQSIWGHIWTPKAVPLLYRDQIRLAGVLWGHRDTTRSEISVNDFFVFNWCYEIE